MHPHIYHYLKYLTIRSEQMIRTLLEKIRLMKLQTLSLICSFLPKCLVSPYQDQKGTFRLQRSYRRLQVWKGILKRLPNNWTSIIPLPGKSSTKWRFQTIGKLPSLVLSSKFSLYKSQNFIM